MTTTTPDASAGRRTACQVCAHTCPDDRQCDKCGSDPMQDGDLVCVECDRDQIDRDTAHPSAAPVRGERAK